MYFINLCYIFLSGYRTDFRFPINFSIGARALYAPIIISPGHNFANFTKCLSVCGTYFVAALAHKLLDESAQRSIFS